MKFRPLHDRVLVRRVEAEEKTAGGIIIPDSAKEKPQEGEVVSVGSGARAEDGTITPLDVKAGDKILFGKWSGTEVKIDGEDLLDHEGKRHPRDRRLTSNCGLFPGEGRGPGFFLLAGPRPSPGHKIRN